MFDSQVIKQKGFTLIELLVVIAIMGILSSIVIASITTVKTKSRDTKRRADLKQLSAATELRYNDLSTYPASAGWFTNGGHGGLDSALSGYIRVSDDPINTQPSVYMYWRKDFVGYTCLTNISSQQFGFYAKLENPTSADTATLTDSFDQCVASTWGMNYKVGN